MTKQEIAAYIAKEAGITAAAANKAISALVQCVKTSLNDGNDVRLPELGTFTRTRREAREGRNPQTGKALKIAASYQAKFKAGKSLKDGLNGVKSTTTAAKTTATKAPLKKSA